MTDAVILAGGFGTRLRPLTETVPKPLVRLAGVPLIRRIVKYIPEDIDRVFIAAGYRWQELADYFKSSDAGEGRHIEVVAEEKPLGTAGALWNLRNVLDDEFAIFNGDVVSSLKIADMISFHRKMNATATISLWEVEEPEHYGTVRFEKEGQITEFREKPKREEAAGRLINAGTYIMQKHVFDFISDGTFSLEREVFPQLCRGLIFGYRFPGYWFDCGSLVSYLKAQSAIINAECLGIEKKAKLEGCLIERPVAVEKGARLRGTRIGPNVYVEEECSIGEGTVLDNCTIMKGARVGKGCAISGSIIGPGCALPDAAGSHNQILVRASE